MKILHTADWHIGHTLYNYDRSDEHLAFFKALTETVRKEMPDVMLVCGDIFHTGSPSAAAQKLYVENMLEIHEAAPEMEIVVIAGNHDSGSKLEIDKELWKHFNLHVRGYISKGTEDRYPNLKDYIISIGNPIKGYVVAIPHCYPQNFPVCDGDTQMKDRAAAFCNALLSKTSEMNKDSLPIVMAAHATVSGSDPLKQEIIVGGLDSIDPEEVKEIYDYMALGHIHFPQNIGPRIRYSGSAIPVSFNETYPHSISIIETDRHDDIPKIRTVRLPMTRKVVTIPENEPVEFEEALKMLEDFPDNEDAYVRLNVKVRQYGGADWADRAISATKGKKCRYCYIMLKSDADGNDQGERTSYSQEEMKKMNPLDIAKIYYKESRGYEMDDELAEMMERAIDDVMKDDIER